MINQSKKVLNKNITKLVNKTYQYGFSTNIEKDIIEKGLNEKTIQLISHKKKETPFLLKYLLVFFTHLIIFIFISYIIFTSFIDFRMIL